MRSSIAETWATGDDDGHGWDGYAVGYELVRPISEDDRQAALSMVEQSLVGATEELVVRELGRLRAVTVSRDIGLDLGVVFAAYAAELVEFPPDIVADVLRDWGRTQRFWPSVAELLTRLNRQTKPRRELREALRRGYREPETSPDWLPPTDDEKAAVSEYLRRHGFSGDRTEKPISPEPFTREIATKVREESAGFRLRDQDDPAVQRLLDEMAAAS